MRTALPLVLVLLCFLTGCLTLDGEPLRLNILSTPQEIQLGEQLAEQIEQKEKISTDAELQAYVTAIGERLSRVSTRQDVPYRFTVIDNPDTVNAFALPGGHMYFYTGLMKLCENEAELAAVMAHEMAHVAAHHHGEAMTRQVGYGFLMQAVFGEDPSTLVTLASNLLGTGIMSYYSRDNEREADALAMEFLFRSGYNPDAMISFMHKLMEEERRAGGGRPMPIFASHPPTQERLERLQNLAQRYPVSARTEGPVYEERYREIVLSRLE